MKMKAKILPPSMSLMRITCSTHLFHNIVQPLKSSLRSIHSTPTPLSQAFTQHFRFYHYLFKQPLPSHFIQKHFYSTSRRTQKKEKDAIKIDANPIFLQNIVSIVLLGNQFLRGSTPSDLKLANTHNAFHFFGDGRTLALNDWYQFVLNTGGTEIILGRDGSNLVLISHHSHSNKKYALLWRYNNHSHQFESMQCEYEKYLKWKSLQLGGIRETLQTAVQRSRDIALRHNTPDSQSLGDAEDVLNAGLAEKTISRLTVSQSVPVHCLYEPVGRVALQVLQAAYYSLNFFSNNDYLFDKQNSHEPDETDKDGYFSNDPSRLNEHLFRAVEDAILVSTNYIVETSFSNSDHK